MPYCGKANDGLVLFKTVSIKVTIIPKCIYIQIMCNCLTYSHKGCHSSMVRFCNRIKKELSVEVPV